jgi:hyperosmotically inducible periplasmic protein
MKLSTIVAVAWLATTPAVATAWTQGASDTQTRRTDEQLSAEIATRIANDKSLSADAVKVTVDGGVVRLTGMVGKETDKATAERLARVSGVVRVENNLISREKGTDAVKGTAGTIADKTEDLAKKTANATKKAAGVTADKAEDVAEKTANATKKAAGVTADKSEDVAEKTASATKKAAGTTKDAVSTTGEVITDGWITSRVKTKFMADDTLRASAIDVDTDNHVVTLTGAVPNAAARASALAMAKDVEGVRRVVDKLKVTDQ